VLQDLQAFPRDRTGNEQKNRRSKLDIELEARSLRRLPSFPRAIPRLEYLAPAAAGLLILGLLTHPDGGGMIVLALVAAAIVPWALYCTSRHVSWLLIVFVLIEAVAASTFAATDVPQLGAFVRYSLGFLFVLPFISSVWKSGILRKGGFRDYTIYLIWALVSVSYSILPEVSLARAIAAILPFCAVCAIAAEVRSAEDARKAMGVLLAGCGVVVAANFLAMFIPACTPWQPDADSGILRFTGFLTEPNLVGNLTLATVGAGFGYWPIASGRQKALAAAVMLGALAQGAMADSRSPIIGIAIGGVVYLVWEYRVRGAIAVAALFAIFYTSAYAIPGMRGYLDRGDVASLTGRQVAWDFAVQSVKESPIVGYGYEVEGQILNNHHFPGWDDVWNFGYQTSLHNGFVSRAVSLGIPALLFWLFLTLRPVLACFVPNHDPWKLRSIAAMAVLPVLVLNFTESVADFRSFAGLMMAVAWSMLECERLYAREQAARRAKVAEASRTPIVRALQAAHAS
jgi:O-antigen ligase